ncbi:MAG: FtsX-like permease family protein [Gemmatimonadetes bacterium]|nr:FtsX-like permease family protein [Gemmatimonadota bacterium]
MEATPPDFWVPITMAPIVENRTDLFTPNQADMASVVARFRPGVSLTQAGKALEQWLRQTTADRPEADRVTGVQLESRATPNPFSAGTNLALMPIVVAFVMVLLTACANVASMMVARGVARQREIGIRLAIGAGRRRLIR